MHSYKAIRSSTKNTVIFWMSILLLISIEYIIFRSFVLREISPFFPANFDQAQCLIQSYILYENILKYGFITAVTNSFSSLSISAIFTLQAAIIFLIFGATRLVALSINFAYFAALQLLVVKVAKDISGKYLFSLLMLGLLLSLSANFYWAGSLIDFRIDYMAFCLYGILITCIIKSNIFLNRKWTVASALVAAYLILLRYITAAYIYPLIGFLIGYFYFLGYWFQRKNIIDIDINIRKKNILIFIFITLMVTVPCLWFARHNIYNYYVMGHVITNEKFIRASQVGVKDFITNIIFYPQSILRDHVGKFVSFILLMLAIITCVLDAYSAQRIKLAKNIFFNLITDPIIVFLIFSITIPIAILTNDVSKSVVVGNIVAIPLVWLFVCFFISRYNKIDNKSFLNAFLFFFSTVIFTVGIFNFTNYFRQSTPLEYKENLTEISKMYENIGDAFYTAGQHKITYSADHIDGYLIPQVLSTLYYEKHKILLDVSNTLLAGNNIYGITKQAGTEELNKSNIFILNLSEYPTIQNDYPYNRDFQKIRSDLKKIADKKFIALGDYNINNSKFRVYIRFDSSKLPIQNRT